MYIFEKPYSLFTSPYPHLVIENFLPEDIATQLSNEYPTDLNWGSNYNPINYPQDSVWGEFYNINMLRMNDTIKILDTAFNKQPGGSVPKVNYTYYEDTEKRMLRGWHVDAQDKKYQILIYLGDLSNGGELEMWDGINIKTFPFVHNRLVAWYNNTDKNVGTLTEHRYYSGNGGRKVFNIPITY